MYEKLLQYQPTNEQEQVDKKAMLEFIKRNDDVLERSNLVAHLTSSAIVLNKEMDKVLFIHHNIYNSWGWVGGHNDGNGNCLEVAIKEAKEETGVENIKPYNDEILGIDVIHVTNHIKNGSFVPDHLHLNITYLLIADEEDTLVINHEENSDVRWFDLNDVMDYVTEERMIPLYTKLFDKARQYKK